MVHAGLNIAGLNFRNVQLEWTESCRLQGNFSVGKQNRVDQSVPPLQAGLAEPLEHELQGSVSQPINYKQDGIYSILVRPFMLSSLDTEFPDQLGLLQEYPRYL